jgi:hypothetical protein
MKEFGGPAKNTVTLRDYFAAAALQGMVTDADNPPYIEAQAKVAYQYADAMLVAREKE